MSQGENPTTQTDGLQNLVRTFAEIAYNDPGETPVPMATTDAEKVIRAQLTENTGTHFLDSGDAYGRNWEDNQETPPWEQPAWNVQRDFVTHNVYHFMDRRLDRNRECVALEAALYGYGRNGPGEGDSWLTCMEGFAEHMLNGHTHARDLSAWGVPEEFIEDVLGVKAEARDDVTPRHSHRGGSERQPVFTMNTYNSEFHGLSQVLQGTNLGGPYADYVFLQVHQGADVRGGYTGPRVYEVFDAWHPSELHYRCEHCEWREAESCVYNDESLVYQRSIDPSELEDEGLIEEGDEKHPALAAAYDDDTTDGAVFHKCGRDGLGYVTFS